MRSLWGNVVGDRDVGVYVFWLALVILAPLVSGACFPGPAGGDGGLKLADGFRSAVFAEGVGRGRQLVVRENGDVYVALQQRQRGGGICALRDRNGDGRADEIKYFGELTGTGIEIREGYLYFGADTRVVRYKLKSESLLPEEPPATIVSGFPENRAHMAKPLAFDGSGHLYVNVGAPSNACQERVRTPGSPGRRPCPELEESGGIWRYDAEKTGQEHPDDGLRYATGLRNCVALAWHDAAERGYVVMHGRDQLNQLFPQHFTNEDNARLPAEEFHLLREGGAYGWPYTYWDPQRGARMVAPEYGGDGKQEAESGRYADPIQAFPAHWAPNDLIFYDGEQFPKRYRGGAFVAFHGSWNRAPLPQAGYKVTFTPFEGEKPSGGYEVFADGFTGQEALRSPRQADHRPMGLAIGPEGRLYISDSVRGRIWRISYEGKGSEAERKK